jgi:hypothetical protein
MYKVLFHYLSFLQNAHDYHQPTFERVCAHKTHIPIHPATKNISLLTFQLSWKLSSDIASA